MLTAVEPATGDFAWNVAVPAHTEVEQAADNTLVVPFTDGEPDPEDNYSSDTGILSIDGAEGVALWQRYLPGLRSTLVLDDTVLAKWDEGRLASAFEVANGQELWRTALDAEPAESYQDRELTGDERTVYWIDGGELVAVDPTSGTDLSRNPLPFSDDIPPDLRYLDEHLLYRRWPTTIGEFDPATGESLWEVDLGGTNIGWEYEGDLISNGELIAVTTWTGEQSSVVKLELGTGAERWRYEQADQGFIGRLTTEGENRIWLARIARDLEAYSATSQLVEIDATTGEQRWSTDPIEQPYSGEPPPRSAGEDMVFVLGSSADRRLYAHPTDTGVLAWSIPTRGDNSAVGRTYDLLGSVDGSPWLAGNDAFWEPSYVTSIDPTSQTARWQIDLTGNDLTLGPNIDGRQIVSGHNVTLCE